MQQKYYTIAIVDKTSNSTFSNAEIKSGNAETNAPKSTMDTVMGRIGNTLTNRTIGMVSQAAGVNIAPAFNLGKAIITGAGAGAIAGAGISLAIQAVSTLISYVNNKIEELKSEAAAANERDNALILSGSLNISGYTIKKGKWGRDEYVYNRG